MADTTSKKLRACLNCSIIQTTQNFKEKGCPNCPFLNVNKGRNLGYTTSLSFKGTIALIDPKHSWIAKWHRIGQYTPGMYAMTVDGVLSDKFVEDIEKDGRIYINRSVSFELE
ncbi:transcription elongation factor spt4 [Glugoides intestinalis]